MNGSSFWSGAILAAIIILYLEVAGAKDELKKLNTNLLKILKADSPVENIDKELIDLIIQGKKIKAVKRYRDVSGYGLKESKEYIDKLAENK